VVKILDLGLARFFEDESDILTQGAVLGSADYIAPEQAIDSHTVDVRGDIYSLGATFWYCLTGNRPPRAGLEFVRRPSQQHSASVQRTDIPEGIWQVLRKMMAPLPADRFQTPSEVVEAITPWSPDEITRLLLTESPPPEVTASSAALQATTETVPEHVLPPAPPPTVPAAPISAPVMTRRRAPVNVHFLRRPWLIAGILTGLAVLGGVLTALAPSRMAVPGRGSAPYFKPVTPHSP
jgi:serine/threonine protein kinase